MFTNTDFVDIWYTQCKQNLESPHPSVKMSRNCNSS